MLNENQRKLVEYYENLLDLFTQEGWKQLVGEIEEEIRIREQSIFDKAPEAFSYEKGVYQTLKRFVTLPLLVEQGYKQLEEQDALV